jgi:hypothetical protein
VARIARPSADQQDATVQVKPKVQEERSGSRSGATIFVKKKKTGSKITVPQSPEIKMWAPAHGCHGRLALKEHLVRSCVPVAKIKVAATTSMPLLPYASSYGRPSVEHHEEDT